MRFVFRNRHPGEGWGLRRWIPAFAGMTALLWNMCAVAEDAPPQGPREDYANYYINTKREGLEPFSTASKTMPEHWSKFIFDYRDMHKDKDAALLDSLIHPASNACDDDLRHPYFESMREFYLNEPLPDGFKVKYFPIAPGRAWELAKRLEFPVLPTHILYIEYQDGEYVEGLQRFIREETSPEKRMYEVMKCPSEASMKAMQAEAEKRLQAGEGK